MAYIKHPPKDRWIDRITTYGVFRFSVLIEMTFMWIGGLLQGGSQGGEHE